MATRQQCFRGLNPFPSVLSSMISSIMLSTSLFACSPTTWADTKRAGKPVLYRQESIEVAKKIVEADSDLDETTLLLYLPLADRPMAAKVIQRLGLDPNIFLEKYVLPYSDAYSNGTYVILASEALEGISEPSLAFILAHELGHNQLHSHVLKTAKAHEIGLSTCSQPCKLSDTELIDAGFAQITLWPKHFFWQAEFDADRLALTRLRKAGFKESPRTLLEGIPAVKREMDTSTPSTGLTVTHPPFEDRIRAMNKVDRQIATITR